MTPRRAATFVLIFCVCLQVSCESTSTSNAAKAPPVTAAMASSGAHPHFDRTNLDAGRSAFLSRCAHCHTLPDIHAQSADAWPGIVAKMTKRSGLSLEEREAVTAYILAARAL